MSVTTRSILDFLRHRLPFARSGTHMPLHLPSHWNALYSDFTSTTTHEWGGMDVGHLAEGLEAVLKKGPTCVVGAGASGLGKAMVGRGFGPVVESDFSEAIGERESVVRS